MLQSKKQFSLFVLFNFLIYALIAVVVFLYFINNIVTHSQFNLSLHTDRPESIQIFCDDGHGFSEARSSTIKTSTAQQSGESFNLSLPGNCKRLRLDLGSRGAIVKISTAALMTSGGDEVDLLS